MVAIPLSGQRIHSLCGKCGKSAASGCGSHIFNDHLAYQFRPPLSHPPELLAW